MRMVAAVTVTLLLAGCQAPIGSGDEAGIGRVLILDALYVLEDEERSAFHGHHCADAYVQDGIAHMNKALRDDLGDGPFLLVEPDIEGMWASTGDAGYPLSVPAEVASEAGDDDIIWATVTVTGDVPFVDGEAVSVPHAFTVQRDGYRIEATLRQGPDQVAWFERDMCM